MIRKITFDSDPFLEISDGQHKFNRDCGDYAYWYFYKISERRFVNTFIAVYL